MPITYKVTKCRNPKYPDDKYYTGRAVKTGDYTFERICECSRHTALTKLKELVKAGRLIAIGPKNQRQYILN